MYAHSLRRGHVARGKFSPALGFAPTGHLSNGQAHTTKSDARTGVLASLSGCAAKCARRRARHGVLTSCTSRRIQSVWRGLWRGGAPVLCGHSWCSCESGSRACWRAFSSRAGTFFSLCLTLTTALIAGLSGLFFKSGAKVSRNIGYGQNISAFSFLWMPWPGRAARQQLGWRSV